MSREKYDSVVLKDKNILIEDLLKLLIEDMHLRQGYRIYKFQIREEENTKMSNNNKTILHHHKRDFQVQQSKYIGE